MYIYKAKCLRVVDGDTIDAQIDLGFDTHKVIRIRLVGINAAESRTKDLEEKAMDNKAITGQREIGYVYDENAYEKKN